MERLTRRHDEFDEIGILNPKDPEGFYEITDLDSEEDRELLIEVSRRLELYEDRDEKDCFYCEDGFYRDVLGSPCKYNFCPMCGRKLNT